MGTIFFVKKPSHNKNVNFIGPTAGPESFTAGADAEIPTRVIYNSYEGKII